MKTIITVILSFLLVIFCIVEATDGFRLSWTAARGFVQFEHVGTKISEARSIKLTKKLRNNEIPDGLSSWNVIDGFPEADMFSGAMYMLSHPSEPNLWYVATFKGVVFSVKRVPDGLEVRKIIDLTSPQTEGLYSIALHPKFDEGKSFIYAFYRCKASNGKKFIRVVSCPVFENKTSMVDDQSVMIEQEVSHFEHLGGGMDFDDSGFLLVGIGDNGLYNDSSSNAQKIGDGLFSGILRLDVDRKGGNVSFASARLPLQGKTGGYYIPLDNPFQHVPRGLPEFWSIGFRNPFRLYFDKEKQGAWVGEVGQDKIEQLEFAKNKSNHLWSFREGTEVFERSYLHGEKPKAFLGDETFPFYEYRHEDQDYCIISGPVYSSTRYPELTGKILIGDNQSGRIWAIDRNDPLKKMLLIRLPSGKDNASLTSICADCQGRIFLTSFASGANKASILELMPVKPIEMPQRLSDTGYFDSLYPIQPKRDFVPYDVNSPLWSDGLSKKRWFKLPTGTIIDNLGDDYTHWSFPQGTVFIKHFFAENAGSPNEPIETRILIWGKGSRVYGATYQWDQEKNDAYLVNKRESKQITVTSSSSQFSRDITYRLPSPEDCLVCHNPDYQALGMYASQLNRLDSSGTHQLLRLSDKGILSKEYSHDAIKKLKKLVGLDSVGTSIEYRARSYLHSNCSFCHHENGTQRTEFSARIQDDLESSKMLNWPAKTFYKTVDDDHGEFVIACGVPEESALYKRLQTEDVELSMPYLGRNTSDREANEVIYDWITQMRD